MVDVSPMDDAARQKIKGHVESYIMSTGNEDSLNRVVGSLSAHAAEDVEEVFNDYEESWERYPEVDPEKLEEVKEGVRMALSVDI